MTNNLIIFDVGGTLTDTVCMDSDESPWQLDCKLSSTKLTGF